MNTRTFAISLAVLAIFAVSKPMQAATVSIDPPTKAVPVASANLKLTVAFDKNSVTPPTTALLTFIITNTGSSIAKNVAIDNLLPIQFTYTNGAPKDLAKLGDLAPGDTITKEYSINIPATVKTNRYVVDASATATNADKIESTATITVNNGKVLGATDTTVGTLAETGVSPLIIFILGFISIILGVGFLIKQKS